MATPIPFLTAVWAGMSHGDILAGLRNGDIVRPGRLPDWATGLDQRPGAPAANSDPPTAVDRARVSAWFTSLDPDLSSSAFQVNWNRVGTNDSDRATKLTSYLSNLPLRDGSSGASGDAVAGLDAYLAGGIHRAKIVDLSGKSRQELATLAKTDIGYRYALAHLDPFTVTGTEALSWAPA